MHLFEMSAFLSAPFCSAEMLPGEPFPTLHLCSGLFPAQSDASYLAFLNPLLQITSPVHLSYIKTLTSSAPAELPTTTASADPTFVTARTVKSTKLAM